MYTQKRKEKQDATYCSDNKKTITYQKIEGYSQYYRQPLIYRTILKNIYYIAFFMYANPKTSICLLCLWDFRYVIRYAVKCDHWCKLRADGCDVSERCDSKWDDLRAMEHLHQSAERLPQRSAGWNRWPGALSRAALLSPTRIGIPLFHSVCFICPTKWDGVNLILSHGLSRPSLRRCIPRSL